MNSQSATIPVQKKSGGCASFIAFVLAILLVLILPLAMLAFDLGGVIFDPPLVKHIITDEVVNSDLLPVALEWFSSRRAQQRAQAGEARTGIDEPDIVLLMSFLDRADWHAIKAEVLTNEIVAEFVSVTVDGVYAWIDSSDRLPQILWNLKPFKDRVNTEHGVKSILIAYDNLQPCVTEQIDDFTARLAAAPPGKEVLYNLCKFPDPWREDQFNDYVNALNKVVANAPHQFELTKELTRGADTAGVGLEIIKQQLRLIRLLMQWAWLVPLVVLLLIVAVGVRSLRDLGRLGVPLVMGGLLALVPVIAYSSLIPGLGAVWPFSAIPDLIKPEAFRVVARLAAAVFRPMLIQAVVVIILGLVLIVLQGIKRRSSQ